MKTKLLGVIGVLVLTVGAANADTYQINGSFASSSVSIYTPPDNTPVITSGNGAELFGTITIEANVPTEFQLSVRGGDGIYDQTFFILSERFGTNTIVNAPGDGNISLFYNFGVHYGAGLSLNLSNGILTVLSLSDYVFDNAHRFTDFLHFSGTIENITPTPLPAALPLFATGLGALGLLGWRRKRKAQAAA